MINCVEFVITGNDVMSEIKDNIFERCQKFIPLLSVVH